MNTLARATLLALLIPITPADSHQTEELHYHEEQILPLVTHARFKGELLDQNFRLTHSNEHFWKYGRETDSFAYEAQIYGNTESEVGIIEGYLYNFSKPEHSNSLAAPLFRYLATLPFPGKKEIREEIFTWINENIGSATEEVFHGIKITLYATAPTSRVIRVERGAHPD